MPLFFLLSGFCLTLAYGRKQYAGFDTCCGPCSVVDTLSHRFFCCGSCQKKSIKVKPEDDSDLPVFDSWKFYFNRFSRVVPVYWFCMLLGVPAIFLGKMSVNLTIQCQYNPMSANIFVLGYSQFGPTNPVNILGFIEAAFGVSTMIIFHGFGPNGPGWTVCTLSIFYWIFPK